MTLLCITTQMHDIRTCVQSRQHATHCDGHEYRWNSTRFRDEATGRLCKGCLPQLARQGLLCFACWEKVQTAYTDWDPFARKLVGVDRAVQRDNGGIRSSAFGHVNIPGTKLAVDEINSYLRTLTDSLAAWVSSEAGARDAVHFARAVPAAIRTHAVEEKPHQLRRLRCPDCGRLSFVRNPPAAPGADITVTCQNEACKKAIHEHDRTPTGEEKLAVIADIEKPPSIAVSIKGMRATGGRDEFADLYDPSKAEHADLDPLTTLTVAELRAFLPVDTTRLNHLRKQELITAIHSLRQTA